MLPKKFRGYFFAAPCSYKHSLKEMLSAGVLSIAIRADFWQPKENERKAKLIKYRHQHAVLDVRMNASI